jgi:hypothetical protein
MPVVVFEIITSGLYLMAIILYWAGIRSIKSPAFNEEDGDLNQSLIGRANA